MSRKASPTAIGAFVLIAVVLVILGVVVLSPDVGEDRETFQLYFEGSVKGLDVGAPVLVKGVRVGRVRSISLRMDTGAEQQQTAYIVPVTVELSRRRLLSTSQNPKETVASLIEKGLRAQLELDSLVTQKLFVDLGFRHDTDANFYDPHDSEFQQIPTVQTGWQELQAELADVDIVQLVAKASSALDGINRILNGPEAIQALSSLEQSLTHLDKLLIGLNQDRQVLTENVDITLAELRETFAEAQGTLRQMDALLQSGELVTEDARRLVQQMETALAQVDEVTENLNGLVEEDSPTVYRAELALEEVTGAARAMRQFLQMLEDKPDALLRGR